jgi:2-phosphosulfolactate phosphatase
MLVRCEWGEAGLAAVLDWADAVVIVDVLCFTTSLSIATARGAVIHPITSARRDDAGVLASRLGARLAVRRREAGPGDFTLSPGTMFGLAPGDRLVLPSANGSALSERTGDVPTYAAALRNAAAVARHLDTRYARLAVVPGGERWPDGSLRVAIEDGLGAGALIARLSGDKSAEAAAAEQTFLASRPRLAALIDDCESGRELHARGLGDDIGHAVKLDTDDTVPMLEDGAYRNVAA